MFTQSIATAYDLSDATWEIIIMLLISFILGWSFHYFWGRLADFDLKKKELIPAKFANLTKNDLKLVEGIGPKIEELLKSNNINTWQDVASTDIITIKEILANAGDRYQMHDPSSWADQAALAVEGKWDALKKYQDLLIGGRTK